MMAWLMGMETVSPERVQRLLLENQVRICDVNARQSWIEGHVPGALNLDPANYLESDLPADKETSLVFYCSGPFCRKAPNAARRAQKMGYKNVKVMSAGIQGWVSRLLPMEGGK